MPDSNPFPDLIRSLAPFEGPFDPFRLAAARFEVETAEIEFWFDRRPTNA